MTDPSHATRWPFMFIVDGLGRNTGWLVIHAPITSSSRKNFFAEYRRQGFGFIGMCSFMNFPLSTEDDPLDYGAVCEGWCHCFREPQNFLPNDRPRVLLSLSDFIDPQLISRENLGSLSDIPAFDFVYVAADKPWKMNAKNWQLALKCLPRLCTDLKLRGLVIGAPPQSLPPIRGLTVWPWLPHHFFLQVLSRSRFLFVPNKLDASPRILAEALCLNIPLLKTPPKPSRLQLPVLFQWNQSPESWPGNRQAGCQHIP